MLRNTNWVFGKLFCSFIIQFYRYLIAEIVMLLYFQYLSISFYPEVKIDEYFGVYSPFNSQSFLEHLSL